MPNPANPPRRPLLLTGARRGIGHATVIRFSSAGWRVITCSRHPFPENCPWDAGPEDHIQVALADHADTTRAIAEIRGRLEGGPLHAARRPPAPHGFPRSIRRAHVRTPVTCASRMPASACQTNTRSAD